MSKVDAVDFFMTRKDYWFERCLRAEMAVRLIAEEVLDGAQIRAESLVKESVKAIEDEGRKEAERVLHRHQS